MNKKVLKIVCGFAVVSLGTVGFSAWIVGLQQSETSSATTINVDTVTNDTQYLSASSTNQKIVIAETSVPESNSGIITAKDLSKGDSPSGLTIDGNALKFSFDSINVLLSEKTQTDNNFTGVKIELDDTANSFLKTTLNDVGRSGSESWSYLTFTPVTLTFAKNFTLVEPGNDGYIEYTLNKSTINGEAEDTTKLSLDWGTYFNDGSPVTYYNSIDRSGKNTSELITLIKNVNNELTTMNKELNNKKITFKLSLVK